MRARVAVLLAGLSLLGGAALAADSWEKDYAQGMASADSNVRLEAVARLDAGVPRAREYLFNILEKEPWFLRQAAIDRLAASGDALEELKKQVEKHPSPLVREGIAWALGAQPATVNEALRAIDDKQPMVRRAVAISVGRNPTKEGVGALVTAFEKEKEFDVRVFVKDALEHATGQYLGTSAVDWKNWWSQNQDRWAPPGAGGPDAEAARKAEAEGKKATETTTSLRDVDLDTREVGNGGPLFVLPDIWRNRIYVENHLASLEDVARVSYIDLPPISKFKGLENIGATGVPFYPIDKLADAFDELRASKKEERIALLAHGRSAWVAMRYATRHPKNVSHLILVSPWSSNKAWWDGRNRIEADGRTRKDLEQERYAEFQVVDVGSGKHNYEPKDPQEREALDRMGWTLFFADPRTSFAQLWYRTSYRDMGANLIPDFDVAKEKGNPVPTLIIVGTHPRSLWTSLADAKAIQKAYPNGELLECPGSANMPMIEEWDRFNKAVRGFFKKYPFRKAK